METETTVNSGAFTLGAVASLQYFITKGVGIYLDAGLGVSFGHDSATIDSSATISGTTTKASSNVKYPSVTSIGLSTACVGAVFFIK